MTSLRCGIRKKRKGGDINKRIKYLQNRNRLKVIENKLMVTKGQGLGRDKLGVWD